MENKIWIMHTKCGNFYPIKPSPICRPEAHGELNSHVVKIEDAFTNKILWERKNEN